MDYGPKGFNALYHEDHPYVHLQYKLGQNIARYAEPVPPIKEELLQKEAIYAMRTELQNDVAKESEQRNSSGFRLICRSFPDVDELNAER